MFFRRRRTGLSLSTILLVAAGMHYTGAGEWTMQRIANASRACPSATAELGGMVSGGVCSMVSGAVGMVDTAANAIGNGFGLVEQYAQNGFAQLFSGSAIQTNVPAALNQISLQWNLPDFSQVSIPGITLDDSALRSAMQRGPQALSGNSALDQLKAAVTAQNIGQRMLQPQSVDYSPQQAVNWLHKGASMGAYGVMPQLTLGSLYAQGGQGIAANPAQANHYLAQALRSVQQLQHAAPQDAQAQAVLGSLPMQPEQLVQQIHQQMNQIK